MRKNIYMFVVAELTGVKLYLLFCKGDFIAASTTEIVKITET